MKMKMKTTLIALVTVLCLLAAAAGGAEEKSAVLYADGMEAGELSLRWFEENPNVPYMGIAEYAEHILRIPLSAETGADGVVTLRNAQGGELICDAAAGKISTPDWLSVVTPQMPLEGAARSVKDSSCGFVRVTEIALGEEPSPVVFDFAGYGIDIYADERDVYLPLFVLSNMMTDIATRTLRYDGEKLILTCLETDPSPDDPVLNSAPMTALAGGAKRPEDVIRQCYAGLCFNFDYFFGHPGRAALDADIAASGLDAALEGLGEEGAAIKAGLLSPDLAEYLSALQRLFTVWLFDGHTAVADTALLLKTDAFRNRPDLSRQLSSESLTDMLVSRNALAATLRSAVTPQRKLAWGDDIYREFGNTAIIRLDSFMPDEAAWDAWYRGEGPFPEDGLGTVAAGLRKARENPDIQNVLFDLTCNGGGSSDVMMAILGLTTGRDWLCGRNVLTGQAVRVTYETDCNFDGVFDEKDAEARFDFNYGVLVTRQAFSCGNLFPIVMRECGAVIIGEPSSGGSCCIQIGTDAHGLRYMMSSAQWQLLDETGRDVEAGCAVDIPIAASPITLVDRFLGALGIDEGAPLFTKYFDGDSLNSLINAWFHVIPMVPAA